MRHRFALALAALVGLAALYACASTPAPDTAPPEALAPFPYSAEQIRDATPLGRTYVFKMTRGDEVVLRTMRFTAVDAEGATMVAAIADVTGAPVAPPEESRATWEELQHHASYPAAATVVSAATVTVPAGTFACQRYTVRVGEDEQLVVDFAVDLPGAPVSLVDTVGGVEVMRMTLERHERPGAP